VALDAADAPAGAAEIVLATAHPAKFPDAMQQITGARPALPDRLRSLMMLPERITPLPNDARAIEAFVEKNARAVKGGVA
jgi:threonine synthase